ncbi:MAG: 2-hydroxyglutaryl-CoA dehydratase [Syntrophomonadaceae bacterium]|nr:2-hydroxyglutaryl-CoA dehydratase [Syntrophomonadaceae bacterium]
MLVAGVDVGSVATKVAIIKDDTFFFRAAPTGWSPRQAGAQVLQDLLSELGFEKEQLDFVVATGYGRVSLEYADKRVTEITCHARGAAYLVPGCSLVIDIGGQDSKAIKIDKEGQVLDFVMNDKCAAGTGRFLQVIAAALGNDVSELSELAADKMPVALNSMCAVFAESEVIGLLASGHDKGEIVAGLHHSIARRIAGMVGRLGPSDRVIFTGGVAKNESLRRCLEDVLGMEVVVPEMCQMAGALGAALIAQGYCDEGNSVKRANRKTMTSNSTLSDAEGYQNNIHDSTHVNKKEFEVI